MFDQSPKDMIVFRSTKLKEMKLFPIFSFFFLLFQIETIWWQGKQVQETDEKWVVNDPMKVFKLENTFMPQFCSF